MGTINSSLIHGNIRKKDSSNESIDSLVKEIVEELSTTKAELINDVEANKLPFTALQQEIVKYIDREKKVLKGYTKDDLIYSIQTYLFSYYQYQTFLDDPLVTTIHAITKDCTLISRIDENGFEVVENTDQIRFDSDESYLAFCEYVANRNDTEINVKKEIQVVTDTKRCKDFILRIDITGRSVNSTEVPLLVFAKTPKKKRDIEQLKKMKMFNDEIEEYTNDIVNAGCGILVGGEGGAGKTNFMNAILELIPKDRRTLVMQSDEELHSKKPNIIFQRTREELGESNLSYDLKDLTSNLLKMRVHQAVLGELRDKETYDFFNAGSSGHIIWASTHFQRADQALSRMLQLIQYANVDLSEEQILRMLSEALDCIYFLKDFKTLEITEVAGFDEKEKKVMFNPIFTFNFNKNKWDRIGSSCTKIQSKIDYYKYRKLIKNKNIRKEA